MVDFKFMRVRRFDANERDIRIAVTLDKQAARIKHTLPDAATKQFFVKSLMEKGHQSLNMETIYSTRKEIADTNNARLLRMITK